MRNFIASEYGRILVIHLGKGELLLESIQKALEVQGIKMPCYFRLSALCVN